MYIHALGTAVPERKFTQLECWNAFEEAPQFHQLEPRSRQLLKKVLLGSNGIRERGLALDKLGDAFETTPNVLHQRFSTHAPRLGTAAAQRALDSGGVQPEEIDALIVSTCTGYVCPGLTSYISERLALRSDCLLLDLVGQGCGAALPNLTTAASLLQSGKCERVLSVCVEICSAAVYVDNDPGVLVSNCLFGDGAGAVLSCAQPPDNGRATLRWLSSHTLSHPQDRELLRFEQRDGMLRNILSLQVPRVAARKVETLLEQAFQKTGFSRSQISGWIFHGGGRDVLQEVQRTLDLPPEALHLSRQTLESYGNVSSPFVLFVLEQALHQASPPGLWWLCSFGAGFSCHGAFLQYSQ